METSTPAATSIEIPQPKVEFVEANGLRFETLTCGESDRLALLLHGFPEHHHSWRYQIPLLASLGYRVWAPNLRGYGKSSTPTGVANYRIDDLLADVAGLIDASGARLVTLIAHDWGAVLAWLFAIRRIRPLERLVIMNVPHPAVFARSLRTLRQLRKSWYVFFFQLPGLPEKMLLRNDAAPIAGMLRGMAIDKSRFPREVLEVYTTNAKRPGGLTAMINYYRANVLALRARSRQSFAAIEVPTLMIWGERDTALGKETTYGTDRYVDDLTIRYLPNVSHWVQQEAPETVNAMLEAFLTGQPVPEASELRDLPRLAVTP